MDCRHPITWTLVLSAVSMSACDDPATATRPVSVAETPPVYVGSAACGGCHADEVSRWQNSQHALAMQPATSATVLGDFADASFDHFGTTSTFLRRDGDYLVRTDDATGRLTEFRVAYTFGVSPLQQYLLETAGGRLQALSVAWDSRPAADGGQRWFHLYPDEAIGPGDPLHWTGRNQNWNYMCAECHSTGLERNYDRRSDTYDTRWSEIDVGCEGCHGPASQHVAAAAGGDPRPGGLLVDLDDRGSAGWIMNAATGIAARSEPRLRPPAQPDACGRCHSRRAPIAPQYRYGLPLLDTHLPSLLDESLYFADGQIRDEVYVWGSFLQSRMYRAGVTCTDCHDPHSATLRTPGQPSAICLGCHLEQRFAGPGHHRHAAGTVACVDCHMPARTYMVVDPRRDHGFRTPRPDLSLATGVPNACNGCHRDRDAAWADAALTAWYGERRAPEFATALAAAWAGAAGANAGLARVAADPAFPALARASALARLAAPVSETAARTLHAALGDPDPLLRLGALRGLASLPGEAVLAWASPLLADPLRAVRLEAASLLAPLQASVDPRYRRDWERAASDYVATQLSLADRPEASVNLGRFFAAGGDAPRAEASYRRAISMDPLLVPARVNLADLYRELGRDEDGRAVLEDGLATIGDNGALQYALGLLLVRRAEPEAALAALERAQALEPANARYVYAYAVGLHSLGQPDRAIEVLAAARQRFAADVDIGTALAAFLRDAGRTAEAARVADELARQFPDDPGAAGLARSLREP